jgi:hypothetical protein
MANPLSLTLPLPRKRLSGCACHSPLAHFYIHHSESSIREIHPFTTITHLASKKPLLHDGEDSISVQFLFRESVTAKTMGALSQPPLKKSTQWTNKLASLIDEEKSELEQDKRILTGQSSTSLSENMTRYEVGTTLRLEGPYFTPANPEAYKTVICFVAGTGLSGAIAIAAAFKAQRARPRKAIKSGTVVSGPTCAMESDTPMHWERCVVIWSVRENDHVDMPFFDG